MKGPAWLPGTVLFIGVLLITIQFWYIVYVSKNKKEGFDATSQQVSLITSEILSRTAQTEKTNPPSDTEAAQYYRALLVYIQSDYGKGLRLVYDLNKRIYGKYDAVPDSFDPRKILDDYKNPIAGI
jgi:hypothetical protein